MDGLLDLRLLLNPSGMSDPHPPSSSDTSEAGRPAESPHSAPPTIVFTSPAGIAPDNANTGPRLPYPQHQTFYWAVARGPEFTLS